MDETRAVYDEIKSELVEATMGFANATMGSSMGSAESQLSQDMGNRILATSKKIPTIAGKEGKDDTEYVREGEFYFALDQSLVSFKSRALT